MRDSSSRSRSPPARSRSRSPPRRRDRGEDRPRKSGGGGFRWKEKRKDGDEERRYERGYRGDMEREWERERDRRARDQERDEEQERKGEQRGRRDPFKKGGDEEGTPRSEKKDKKDRKDKKERKEKQPKVQAPAEPMIIVNVNDRLGTKAAIPCLASDPIKLFKAQVAARIGRQPHEIMLKRQGERPFKDMLTLADYGVSNGVQLDLELDTGD
ncbi:MAG: hypothetical protein Q9165_000197 [Trypethelium subeluteriae]